VSPSLTIESIYLCKLFTHPQKISLTLARVDFYMAVNLGSTGAISASFLARDNGFWVAYLVPTCVFAAVPIVLFGCRSGRIFALLAVTNQAWARKYYVVTPPRGSILLETFRVIGVCLVARWSWNPIATWRNITRSTFWDPAKPGKCSLRPACIP
jgi:POT family proton-dependent oligopeptide transporter